MNRLNRLVSHPWSRGVAALAAFCVVWSAPIFDALAAPHAEEHAAEGHAESASHLNEGIKWIGDGFLGGPGEDGRTGFLIILINFAVLLVVLNKLLFKNLVSANAEKSDTIRLELERATEARSKSEDLLKEYETKLSALEVEIEDILAKAKVTAAAEHARILAEAEVQAEKVKAAAIRAAEREAARHRTELENELVDQALAKAEQAIRASFVGTDQRRLIDAWVGEVSAAKLSDKQAGGPN